VNQDLFFKLKTGHIAKATLQAGWYDIFSSADAVFYPGVMTAVKTGITAEMSPNLRARICEKSGRALAGLEVHAGCIDSDFCKPKDEWLIIMTFNAPSPDFIEYLLSQDAFLDKQKAFIQEWRKSGHFVLPAGTAIAQFKLELIPIVEIIVGDSAICDMPEIVRDGGLGSTDEHFEKKAAFEHLGNLLNRGVELISGDLTFKAKCKNHKFMFGLLSGVKYHGTIHELISLYGPIAVISSIDV
jgi:hypothetical protein